MSRGRGRGERYAYADADTIPEIAPSTEREGESPTITKSVSFAISHRTKMYQTLAKAERLQ